MARTRRGRKTRKLLRKGRKASRRGPTPQRRRRGSNPQRGGNGSSALPASNATLVTANPIEDGDLGNPDAVPTVMSKQAFQALTSAR